MILFILLAVFFLFLVFGLGQRSVDTQRILLVFLLVVIIYLLWSSLGSPYPVR